jgi:site-specific DNA-methyltransferase (adenine-specific)
MKIHGLERIRRVMDPFVGIGTTAIASVQLNKKCVGFEVDRDYLREASIRLREAGGAHRAAS